MKKSNSGARPRRAAGLRGIVAALGGDLYAGGRRANIPAPGHGRADRSVSLLLVDGRVIVHSFGAATWQEVLADLRARGLIDQDRSLAGGAPGPLVVSAPAPDAPERRAAARRLWADGAPLLNDSPAARYCARRCVPLPLERLEALRGHAAAPLSAYRPGRACAPALLAAVRDFAGGLTAVEVTYLTFEGERRRLRLPRKAVGVLPAGCAVRLAPAAPEMLVAEGVFTALSAMGRFQLPGWALLSATNLARWRPPQGVRRVLIAADRGEPGEKAAARLAAELARQNVAAIVRLPPAPYGDFNDLAQAEATERT